MTPTSLVQPTPQIPQPQRKHLSRRWVILLAVAGVVILAGLSGRIFGIGLSFGYETELNCDKNDIQTYRCVGIIFQQGRECVGFKTEESQWMDGCGFVPVPTENGNTNITVDTAGWETFTDPDGQYSFRHPKTLSVVTKENPRPSYPNITVMHSLPEFGPWFPNVDLSIKKQSKGGFAVSSRSDKTMNLDPDVFFILASTGDQAAEADEYFIRFYQQTELSKDFEDTASHILASFVFLDPDANWNSYTNTENNYSLKYPTDWQVTEKFGKDHVRLLPPGVDGDAPSETDQKGAIAVETSVTKEVLEETLLAPINDLYGTHGLMRGVINYDVYLFSQNGRNISLWRNVDFSDQRFREIVRTFNYIK